MAKEKKSQREIIAENKKKEQAHKATQKPDAKSADAKK